MMKFSLLFTFVVSSFYCIKNTNGKNVFKRTILLTDLSPNLNRLACDRGTMSIECGIGASVYVLTAIFGRTEQNSICTRGGSAPRQQICSSPKALDIARTECYSKRVCTIPVNEEYLGVALTPDGDRCEETSKYLNLEYECVSDCKSPRYGSGVAVIGTDFALGSSVTVKCRDGYAASSEGEPIHEITCRINGTWTGGSISCEDVDECADDELNACDWHADCTNIDGGYTCLCGHGYFGDGFSCNAADIDRSWMDPIKNQSYRIETDSNCGGKLFETSGMLQSPNYPSLYPNSANCEWVLSVPPDKILEIQFLDFQLEQQVQDEGCSRDYVTIYDGPYSQSQSWLATYCGSGIPLKIKSSLNQLRIEFKTDPEASFSGFRALYRSFDPLAVCENFIGNQYMGAVIVEGTRNASATAGDRVVLGCEDGFDIKKDSNVNRICQNDNTWNDISNPCKAMQCSPPKQFQDERIRLNGSSNEYHYKGRPLMYSCVEGYTLVTTPGMKTIIICSKQGQWSNEGDEDSPECRPISCEITEDMSPPHHTFWKIFDEHGMPSQAETGRRVNYNSAVEYSCAKGYSMIGEPRRSCKGRNNFWSGRSVFCEEDNGVPGLSNLQIAIIIACVSIAVILVVGASLLYCCVNEKKRKDHRIRGTNRIRHHSGNSYYRAKFQYTGDRVSLASWAAAKRKTADSRSQRNSTSSDKNKTTSLQEQYVKRPYMLPTVVQPSSNVWPTQTQAPYTSLPDQGQGAGQDTFSSNFYAYNAARPNNRSKDSYAKYQKKFKKR